ncbi:DUF3325 domain-containing protein [Wenzhouxiangella sp. XN201]|uniref:DUF3325 family protein n=1 Tax=Wenzhouxiangella sp. XN201 TaxID=2710755 RepID=UPI0013C92FBC|nr:DUF3325 family protein [Wenzhouxiangella sp. XN201]NEZ04338.1 DUF3325 domain-containing protein [Wenzhouxiangella sp. XN201]
MTLAPAIALTTAGVLALRLAWHWGRQQQPRRQLPLRCAGWLLLAIGLAPWVLTGGSDRGVALAVLVVMLAGLALALFEGWRAWRAPIRRKREPTPRNDLPKAETRGASLLLRRLWIFCLAGPLALAAALAIGLALWLGLGRIGVSDANVLAVAMLSVPIVWSILAVLSTMEGSLGSRTLLVALPGLLGLALAGVAA